MNKQLNRILVGFSLLLISFQPYAGGTYTKSDTLPTLAPMLKKAMRSAVNIATEGKIRTRSPYFSDPRYQYFNRPSAPKFKRTKSLGSGFIIDARNGYILTNNHVIKYATKIVVVLHDQRRFIAKVIGTDAESDIAVIKIEASNLYQIPIGNSNKLRVGDFVVAIGNPFGLGQSVSSGIVSALGRSGLKITSYQNFIQTDASINPGSSGGPLVNLRGEVVGMNTAILSKTGGNIGIGFAIPINTAYQLMNRIIKHGSVRRGLLGVHIQSITPQLSRGLGIKLKYGALIANVQPGSAATRAGLTRGDIIIRINRQKISNARALHRIVGLMQIGDRIKITYLRNGTKYTTRATLTAKKTQRQNSLNPSSNLAPQRSLHRHLAGVTFANDRSGVRVVTVTPRTRAWNAGLQRGDIIVSVNRKRVANLSQFRKILNAAKRNPLLLNIRRGAGALYIYLE